MTTKQQKQDAARRAAEALGTAKKALIDALKIAEANGLADSSKIDKLAGATEALQALMSAKAHA